jgi:hypothetical protein
VATKHALRAILKTADLCATQPERVAQRIVDHGFTPRYAREYDPEDTLRYYACACMKSAGSNRFLRRSSPRTPIGASSTN